MRVSIVTILTVLMFGCLYFCANAPVDISVDASTQEKESTEEVAAWKISKETVKYSDGSIDEIIEYEYSESGNLIRVTEKDTLGEILYVRDYEWLENNLQIMQVSVGSKILFLTNYVWDANGNLEQETKQNFEGLVITQVRYEYDGDKLTESQALDGVGELLLLTQYTYDDNGLPIKIEYRDSDGKLEAREERRYENGRIVKEQTILSDGRIETTKYYNYDENKLASIVYFASKDKVRTVRYQYDGNGNKVKETWSNYADRKYEIIETQWTH